MNSVIRIEDMLDIIESGKPYLLVDLRRSDEIEEEPMLKGSVHIPMNRINQEIDNFPDDEPIYLMCAHGIRAQRVAMVLSMAGKNPVVVAGGMENYNNYIKYSYLKDK